MTVVVRPVPVALVRPLRGAVLRPGRPPEAAVWPGDDAPGAVHLAAYDVAAGGTGCDGGDEPASDDLPADDRPADDLPADDLPPDDGAAGGEPVGVLTLLPAAYPGTGEAAYQLRGMAVEPGRQGRGVGERLMAAALAAVRDRGATLLWCNARVSAEAFYARAGFVPDGDRFTPPELGIVHVRMRRALARPP